jgi:hypothetical protein
VSMPKADDITQVLARQPMLFRRRSGSEGTRGGIGVGRISKFAGL